MNKWTKRGVTGLVIVLVLVATYFVGRSESGATTSQPAVQAATSQAPEVAQLKQQLREAKDALVIKTTQANALRVAAEGRARGKSADTSIRAVVGRAADVSAVVTAAGELAKKKDANDVAFVEMSTKAPARPLSAVEIQRRKNAEAERTEQKARLQDKIAWLRGKITEAENGQMSMESLLATNDGEAPSSRVVWRRKLVAYRAGANLLNRQLAETQAKLIELR